jgi:predicted outer membrane repeat protein
MKGCVLEKNVTERGGGIYCDQYVNLLLEGCLFIENRCVTYGGAVYIGERCTLGIRGGAFQGNEAGLAGGGVYDADSRQGASLHGVVFVGNLASLGGAAFTSSVFDFESCTIADNRAREQGGGIFQAGQQGILQYSILFGNCSDTGEGDEAYISKGSSIVVTCSDFDGSGVGGGGTIQQFGYNLSIDPLFCNPLGCGAAPFQGGDYGIDASSPLLPDANPCGALIGAVGEHCGGGTPVVITSWARLKKTFVEELTRSPTRPDGVE